MRISTTIRTVISIFLTGIFIGLGGCTKHPPEMPYVEHEYGAYYRLDSLVIENHGDQLLRIVWGGRYSDNPGWTKLFSQITDPEELEELHLLYGDGCIYKGRQFYWILQNTGPNYRQDPMCAIDLRINDIDVITLTDWDEGHPAGSSVRDLLALSYSYCDERYVQALTEVPGMRQLVDYYWSRTSVDYFPYEERLQICFQSLEPSSVSLRDSHLIIRITDSHDRVITATYRPL